MKNLNVQNIKQSAQIFCTERNKWYILTHLGESGYCLQINPNYPVNWPNCCKFSGQWPRSLWNPRRWKSQFTPQPATQFTVLYHWEVSVRISTVTLRFCENLSYFLFILHCYKRIYIDTPCWLCMFSTYYYSFIRLYYKFTYLKTSQLPQRLEPASFCSSVQCTIHYTKQPGSSLWYF